MARLNVVKLSNCISAMFHYGLEQRGLASGVAAAMRFGKLHVAYGARRSRPRDLTAKEPNITLTISRQSQSKGAPTPVLNPPYPSPGPW